MDLTVTSPPYDKLRDYNGYDLRRRGDSESASKGNEAGAEWWYG